MNGATKADRRALTRGQRNAQAIKGAVRAMREAAAHFQVLAEDTSVGRATTDEWSRQADACRLCAERMEEAMGAFARKIGI